VSAVEELLDQHAEMLRSFLGARCRDTDLTADLMQEVALRLVRAAGRLDAGRNVRGYLLRTAANVWRDHLRRELVRRRELGRVHTDGHPVAPPADARVLGLELAAAVRRVIAGLPAAQRDVVRLRHVEGLRFREIAERLGRPLGTVLTQMRTALERIATALEEYR